MKLLRISLLIVLTFVLVGCAARESIVVLPDPLKIVIAGIVSLIVGIVFVQVIAKIPGLGPILMQYQDQVSLFLSGTLILWIGKELALIPAQWENVATLLLNLLVAILALFGIPLLLIRFAREKKLPGFRS